MSVLLCSMLDKICLHLFYSIAICPGVASLILKSPTTDDYLVQSQKSPIPQFAPQTGASSQSLV